MGRPIPASADSASIEHAMSALVRALDGIRKAVEGGAVGPDVEAVLVHASTLLAWVDEELATLDRADYPEAFEAAPVMRDQLAAMRRELGIQ